jgi:hypothetical protein
MVFTVPFVLQTVSTVCLYLEATFIVNKHTFGVPAIYMKSADMSVFNKTL